MANNIYVASEANIPIEVVPYTQKKDTKLPLLAEIYLKIIKSLKK